MKVSQFIRQDIDIDVYDDMSEDLGIAFVGPVTLSPAGTDRFKNILDLDITIGDTCAILHIPAHDSESLLEDAVIFFNSAAGYCSVSEYERLFGGQ